MHHGRRAGSSYKSLDSLALIELALRGAPVPKGATPQCYPSSSWYPLILLNSNAQ